MRPRFFVRLFPLLLLCLLVLAASGSVSAEDAVTTFTLPEQRAGVADMSGADLPWLDTALGVVDLPGTAGAYDDETTYDKAWRMQDGPGGTTRLTYGERYRRNPDGSYGAQSSSQWSGVNNVADRLLEQALSAGSGYFSSWAAGWLGGYGKARISVRVNDEGDVTGSGDFLLPLYDSEATTFFTQLGLRTMANDRVIGNFGLGQRFFPAENLAFGYNAFIDQDFSRNHTRGGVGLEAWYDWLRLSTNYYSPLSGWKGSKDYDSRLVEERPAEGYDARLTGYLPFYRNLAVTGAFEQWKGDHVGSFGTDDVVQKDPKVWSYGLEWTPVPAFSTSVNQRHSGGQKETQFGLTFNYHFGMDWEDQLSPAMVTEMRTVDGSRHDFVNRQNEMILEYRAKEGVYNITLLRTVDAARNIFEFQLTNAFGAAVGQTVTVSVDGGATVLDPATGLSAATFTTDANGRIQIQVSPQSAGVIQVTLSAGKSSQAFSLNVTPLARLSLSVSDSSPYVNDDVTVMATLLDASGQGLSGVTLTWVSDPTSAVTLTPAGDTGSGGVATATLTSSTAQTVRVKASATVNGVLVESDWVDMLFSASDYKLTANPDSLVLNQATNVTFTLLKNNSPMPNGTDVITFTNHSDFNNLNTLSISLSNNDGTFSMSNLTGTATGTKTLSAMVDGQTVTCEVKVTGLRLAATDGDKFVTSSDPGYSAATAGYQSTGKIVAEFDDGSGSGWQPISETITWTLISVTAPSGNGTWWKQTANSGATTHGLAWGNNFTNSTPENAELFINGTTTTINSQIEITDIVGSRSVDVEASVTIDSVTYTQQSTVSFGDGPLSVFSGTISSSGEAWSTAYTINDFRGATGTNVNVFKAPVGTCGGTVYNGEMNSSGVINGSNWVVGESGGSYSRATKLPTVSQLLAVAKSSGKGAAFAAGWMPVGTYNYAWTGEVYSDGGIVHARVVYLDNGYVDWYIVGLDLPAAVCRRL